MNAKLTVLSVLIAFMFLSAVPAALAAAVSPPPLPVGCILATDVTLDVTEWEEYHQGTACALQVQTADGKWSQIAGFGDGYFRYNGTFLEQKIWTAAITYSHATASGAHITRVRSAYKGTLPHSLADPNAQLPNLAGEAGAIYHDPSYPAANIVQCQDGTLPCYPEQMQPDWNHATGEAGPDSVTLFVNSAANTSILTYQISGCIWDGNYTYCAVLGEHSVSAYAVEPEAPNISFAYLELSELPPSGALHHRYLPHVWYDLPLYSDPCPPTICPPLPSPPPPPTPAPTMCPGWEANGVCDPTPTPITITIEP